MSFLYSQTKHETYDHESNAPRLHPKFKPKLANLNTCSPAEGCHIVEVLGLLHVQVEELVQDLAPE